MAGAEDIVYPENTELYLQAELQDSNNKIVSGATVKADVYKGTTKLDTISLTASSWYYHGKFFFEDSGEYKIIYTAIKDSASVSGQVVFFVGNKSELSKEANFTVNIVSPSSSVYIKDSVINVRAKVTEDGEAVKDALVVVFFEGLEIEMDYDQFGNYITSIGPLTEGEYKLKVVASKDEMISQDSTLFMISRHILNIDTISPYYNQEFELKKGESLNIMAIVLDEDRDIVPGALVVAKILEPNGRALQMQLFQDGVTGHYSANFYLDRLDGRYSLMI